MVIEFWFNNVEWVKGDLFYLFYWCNMFDDVVVVIFCVGGFGFNE